MQTGDDVAENSLSTGLLSTDRAVSRPISIIALEGPMRRTKETNQELRIVGLIPVLFSRVPTGTTAETTRPNSIAEKLET